MAPTIPVGELTSARAGDSWIWKQSFPEYPVSEGWALAYTFKGPGELATLTAEVTNDGSATYTVTIPAARTASLDKGTYQWAATMTGSGTYAGRRDTVSSGVIDVLADLPVVDASTVLSPDERLLNAIDDVIYGRVTDDVEEVTIAGRSIKKIPIAELLSLKSKLERRVWRLRNPGQSAVARVVFS